MCHRIDDSSFGRKQLLCICIICSRKETENIPKCTPLHRSMASFCPSPVLFHPPQPCFPSPDLGRALITYLFSLSCSKLLWLLVLLRKAILLPPLLPAAFQSDTPPDVRTLSMLHSVIFVILLRKNSLKDPQCVCGGLCRVPRLGRTLSSSVSGI